ncbi:hypothetical protein ACR782_15585 [Sphingobacterium spiritivorum]|uniref:hypothetical protein n=1 Tax=Sphingobacterium spiritivorum TaxID=258 RepID=UPI003DA307B1
MRTKLIISFFLFFTFYSCEKENQNIDSSKISPEELQLNKLIKNSDLTKKVISSRKFELKNGKLFQVSKFASNIKYLYEVDEGIYIGDGIAIEHCNDLFNGDPGNQISLLTYYSGQLYYGEMAIYGKSTIGTSSGTQAQYFECWIDHDPIGTVKRISSSSPWD